MKIAIALHGQCGDLMTAMSVLRYRDELWGKDCQITWFAAKENFDLLKFQNVEVKEFPRGFGYPEMVVEENRKLVEQGEEPKWANWLPLVNEFNTMNKELQNNYPELSEFDEIFFPAPHQVLHRHRVDVPYTDVSKRVFRVPDNYEWHPTIIVSKEEEEEMTRWFPPYNAIRSKINPDELVRKPAIAIESFCGSGQSIMNEEMIKYCMRICRDIFGECYFIFVSHKYLNGNETFPDWLKKDEDVYFASHFTVRQCAYIVNCCKLLISVSSGISVASSCWQYKEHANPIVQFCGSEICSTKGIATGRFELVTADYKAPITAAEEYYIKLIDLCNDIKQ